VGRFLSRKRDGSIRNRLDRHEVALLTSALEGLRSLLLAGDEPIAYRLRPPAYAGDLDFEEEYQATTADDLLRGRLEGLDRMLATLGERTPDEDDLTAWMTTANALRLVLGTRLDVGEDDPGPPADPEEAALWALYQYLSAFLWEVVEVLQDGLPATGRD
jgi:hypothetical protein